MYIETHLFNQKTTTTTAMKEEKEEENTDVMKNCERTNEKWEENGLKRDKV